MKSNMRRLAVLAGLMLMATTAIASAPAASASGNVVATFAAADLGQGVWGGAPLFADGSAGGNIAFSAFNGQVILQAQPTSWTWVVPGQLVTVCSDITVIKNELGFPFPPSMCFEDLPVTGTPVLIDENGDGHPDFVVRVTLTH